MAYTKSILKLIVLISLLFASVTSQRHRQCKDTFCSKIRDGPKKPRSVTLDFGSKLNLSDKNVETNLNIDNSPSLQIRLQVIEGSIFHLLVDEIKSSRYRATDALVKQFEPSQINAVRTSNALVTVTHGDLKALIYRSPFKLEFYNNNTLLSVANWNNSVIFQREKSSTAVALDISFPNVDHAYGLPLHTDNLALRNTRRHNQEPYRLYNVNSDGYKYQYTEARHGSVPVLYAHGTKQSSGAFWLNSAQTWVDINSPTSNQLDAYFMSEAGVIELFILTGPTLPQAVMQYAKLTGVAPLPSWFALGYHHSLHGWSQYDVAEVGSRFISSDLPLDALWLDVEYTADKRSFTWHPNKFPIPFKLLQELDTNHQKLVAMIHPHLKHDDNDPIHSEAKLNHYYIKGNVGNDYSASCFSGVQCSWLDFLNPYARQFYMTQYTHMTASDHSNLHIWNDMNEPIVLNVPDNTLPGAVNHYNNYKHLEVHNIYGFYQTVATRTAMLERPRKTRPFLLTNSHFAGTQRYAAVSTGNSDAEWRDLEISVPMCLTEALAGISFCGADVGGFKGIPDDDLLVRWYQAGAWLPFYRGRYTINVPPREPYLYNDDVKNGIRNALRQRYAHIPLWYLLFREHEMTGEPVIRPITYHYPKEKGALGIDSEILVGPNVLVAPVVKKFAWVREVYFPGGVSQIWYNINDRYNIFYGIGMQTVEVDLDSIPVFYRGGSIIPRKDKESGSTKMLCSEKYTLYIAPDKDGNANGSLYEDDCDYVEDPYGFRFVYANFTYSNKVLTSKVDWYGWYPDAGHIEKIILLNPPSGIVKTRTLSSLDLTSENIRYDVNGKFLEITYNDSFTINVKDIFTVELLSKAGNFKISVWLLIILAIRFVAI